MSEPKFDPQVPKSKSCTDADSLPYGQNQQTWENKNIVNLIDT
jgi:hypothetical protein